MSRKLYGILAQLAGTYDFFAIPDVLNHYGVSFEQLAQLKTLHKPELTYLVLQLVRVKVAGQGAAAKRNLQNSLARGRHVFRQIRREIHQLPAIDRRLSSPQVRRLLQAFRLGESDLHSWSNSMFQRAGEFYLEDGRWVGEVRGTFSTPSCSDQAEQDAEQFVRLVCPACNHRELVQECSDDVLDDATEFTHLSGPYCRCSECDNVVRPEVVENPGELPKGWSVDLDFEWDDYEEGLDGLVDALRAHLVKHGYPEPDQLRIDITCADWRGSSAWADCEVSGEAIAGKLQVNGEYDVSSGKLICRSDGNAFMVCRFSHHDVPMGSSVTIAPQWSDDLQSGDVMLDFPQLQISREWLAEVAGALLPEEAPEKTSRDSLVEHLETLFGDNLPAAEELEEDGDFFGLALALLSESLRNRLAQGARVDVDEARQIRACFDAWLDT